MSATPPRLSVLVAVADPGGAPRVTDLIAALSREAEADQIEVVVARRAAVPAPSLPGDLAFAVLDDVAPDGTTLPALRARALRSARGDLVAVLGDAYLPAPGWIAAVLGALCGREPAVDAAGGCVLDGLARPPWDLAAFLFEYGALLPPVPDGPARRLPDVNVCYRRAAIHDAPAELLEEDFWGRGLHPELRGRACLLHARGTMRVLHVRPHALRDFTRQRFHFSRHLAGTRFRTPLARAGAAVVSPLLVPLLLGRVLRQALAARPRPTGLLPALPYLAWFALVAAAGELTGALLGPGRSLEELT